MKQKVLTLLAGMLLGMALLSGGHAAANFIATPGSQSIYVDGQPVQLEAYAIHGNNFVKLRDVGEAVGINVYWDGSAVQIESDKPYTGVAPVSQTAPPPAPSGSYTITTDHWSREDFSRQANPSVFTGVYSRELYNTIRQTLVDGTSETAPAYTMVAKGADYSAVKNVLGRMEGYFWYDHHVPENFTNYWQYLDYFAVSAEIPETYQEPLDFIQPVIAEVDRMGTDSEKVTYLNDYLCTLMAYKVGETAGITRTFAPHDGELLAACGSYAHNFKFLCGAAGIPCFTVRTADHSWNMVYVDGQWLHVDVSLNDLTNSHTMLLRETYPNHPDRAPEQTAFLKELLVPGSTK